MTLDTLDQGAPSGSYTDIGAHTATAADLRGSTSRSGSSALSMPVIASCWVAPAGVFGLGESFEDREDGARHQGSAWFADGVVEDVRIGEPDHNGSGDLGGHGSAQVADLERRPHPQRVDVEEPLPRLIHRL